MNVSQYKKYLPKPFESKRTRDIKYIHAAICVYLLTIIQREYQKITYKEFCENFEKYVVLTKSEDNPCLYYQSGKNKGKLKIPNTTTFAHTWIPRYNVHELIEDFKDQVSEHIAGTTLRDYILDIPEFIEKETETFNKTHAWQQELLDDHYENNRAAYQNKALQETKNNSKSNIHDDITTIQDYLLTKHQESNQSEVYKPNHDRIIEKYHDLENTWEED